jgi:hypothetical protein
MTRWTSIFLFIGCISCSPNGQADQSKPSSETPAAQNIALNNVPEPAAPPVPATLPSPNPFPPLLTRNLNDLVAACPHHDPSKRPRGSNCYGIFPEQCGADKAKAFVGQMDSATLRERIRSFTPAGGARFIKPSEAVTEDLRYDRLNVHIDETGRISTVDCY